HELREADYRKAMLDVDKLRNIVQALEEERALWLPDAPAHAARLAHAEATATQFAQKVAALELLADELRRQNDQLNAQLATVQKEVGDWDTLYQGFKSTQARLANFEQLTLKLEAERDRLLAELAKAQNEITALQLELQQKADSLTIKKSVRKGGMALSQLDDLKTINGISPYVERLAQMGINTFLQISRWDDDAVIAVAKSLDISPGKIYRDDWVGQAQRLAGERR
ncbi:MAG: hypothetical protein ACK4Q5_21255, partial [Saprospiraceae bacterium]